MKKLAVILVGLFAVAALSTSCKKCTCVMWVNGEKNVYSQELTDAALENGARCADISTVVEVNGKKTGLECK